MYRTYKRRYTFTFLSNTFFHSLYKDIGLNIMYLQFLSWAMQLRLQIGNTIFILTQTCMSWLCWRLLSSTELPHLLSPVHLYETFNKSITVCLFVCFSSQQFCAYLVVIRAFSQSLKPILSFQLSSLPPQSQRFLTNLRWETSERERSSWGMNNWILTQTTHF